MRRWRKAEFPLNLRRENEPAVTSFVKLLSLGFSLLTLSCPAQTTRPPTTPPTLQTGAAQTNLYLNDLRGKRVGMVVNHTSQIGPTHLVLATGTKRLQAKPAEVFAVSVICENS